MAVYFGSVHFAQIVSSFRPDAVAPRAGTMVTSEPFVAPAAVYVGLDATTTSGTVYISVGSAIVGDLAVTR